MNDKTSIAKNFAKLFRLINILSRVFYLIHHYPRSVHGVNSAQPDGGASEKCIAALNISFYPDGAKLHDVGCEHRKPVLCE